MVQKKKIIATLSRSSLNFGEIHVKQIIKILSYKYDNNGTYLVRSSIKEGELCPSYPNSSHIIYLD